MSEFPLDLYPPADFTREDILRQIFGEVGNLCHGELAVPMLTAMILQQIPFPPALTSLILRAGSSKSVWLSLLPI